MSNFQFLHKEFPQLYETAQDVEKYLLVAPKVACISARTALEMVVDQILDDPQSRTEKTLDLNGKIRGLGKENILRLELLDRAHHIRVTGNRAAHPQPVGKQGLTYADSTAVARALFDLSLWLARKYGKPGAYRDLLWDAAKVPLPTADVPHISQEQMSEIARKTIVEYEKQQARVATAQRESFIAPVAPSPNPPTLTGGTIKSRVITVKVDGTGDVPDLPAAVRQAGQGDTVRLCAGQHTLSKPLVVQKDLRLRGDGADKVRVVCAEAVMRLEGNYEWWIEGIGFEHQGSAPANVIRADDGLLHLSHCTVKGGVEGDKTAGAGLYLAGTMRGSVTGCQFQENAAGILLSGASDLNLESNQCRKNKSSGIAYLGTSCGVASNNLCEDNKNSGVSVQGQSHPALESNNCRKNEGNGIVYFDNSSGDASNNICADNEGNGISVQERSQPTLESNQCRNNRLVGIAYLGTSNGVARNNICEDNHYGILSCEQSHPTLENNHCRKSMDGIVYIGTSSGAARNNVCEDNKSFGISIKGQSQPTLENNQCRKNEYGIAYNGNSGGVARNNLCEDNKIGIFIEREAQPRTSKGENILRNNLTDDWMDLRRRLSIFSKRV